MFFPKLSFIYFLNFVSGKLEYNNIIIYNCIISLKLILTLITLIYLNLKFLILSKVVFFSVEIIKTRIYVKSLPGMTCLEFLCYLRYNFPVRERAFLNTSHICCFFIQSTYILSVAVASVGTIKLVKQSF